MLGHCGDCVFSSFGCGRFSLLGKALHVCVHTGNTVYRLTGNADGIVVVPSIIHNSRVCCGVHVCLADTAVCQVFLLSANRNNIMSHKQHISLS